MRKIIKQIFPLILFFSFLLFLFWRSEQELLKIYQNLNSKIILDREGREIAILPNERGYYSRYLDYVPEKIKKPLLEKEDKIFYWHLGFNPKSLLEYFFSKIGLGSRKGASTISQQLVKILLGKEKERSLKNKIIESFYTLSLELFEKKENILKMYLNSVYFGNQCQGIWEASRYYFGVDPEMLTPEQITLLLETIPNPNDKNPAKKGFLQGYQRKKDVFFEISSLKKTLEGKVTIDLDLNEKIREIVKKNIEPLKEKNAKNAAVVVILLPENEILALVGSPNPQSQEEGYQINMLKVPRAIGSTIKPFIYLKAFEKGLRPYTLVEDREYKYITALGFPLYPKNFDWQYHGEVSLYYALANSLNVPAVKVLEYVGLEDFWNFLIEDLGFQPIQDLKNYQLGIALGVLEMNLLDLSKYFTIFPNGGILRDLKIFTDENQKEKEITKEAFVQLVNKILNDRYVAIDQFGLKSDLNLFQKNYCLKTGTSKDFRDSWIIGFTPDFLVGVWVGNADNTPTEEISGQLGAGRIWADIMELLFNSKYNKKTPLRFDQIKEFIKEKEIQYSLEGDDYEKILYLLKEKEGGLILHPHDGDVFLLEEKTQIVLRARETVDWFLNQKFWGSGKEIIFLPENIGTYKILAKTFSGEKEEIEIFLKEK